MFMSCVLLTFVIGILCSKGNSDIRLLLFLKDHVYRPVNSVGMFNTLERLC